jgi:hypothetical protein
MLQVAPEQFIDKFDDLSWTFSQGILWLAVYPQINKAARVLKLLLNWQR